MKLNSALFIGLAFLTQSFAFGNSEEMNRSLREFKISMDKDSEYSGHAAKCEYQIKTMEAHLRKISSDGSLPASDTDTILAALKEYPFVKQEAKLLGGLETDKTFVTRLKNGKGEKERVAISKIKKGDFILSTLERSEKNYFFTGDCWDLVTQNTMRGFRNFQTVTYRLSNENYALVASLSLSFFNSKRDENRHDWDYVPVGELQKDSLFLTAESPMEFLGGHYERFAPSIVSNETGRSLYVGFNQVRVETTGSFFVSSKKTGSPILVHPGN